MKVLLFITLTISLVDLSYQKPSRLPQGMPTGHPLANNDWPWELMYDDLMWAMDKLQHPESTSKRQLRMASTIVQAWMGEIENMRVHHQENASNQPVEA